VRLDCDPRRQMQLSFVCLLLFLVQFSAVDGWAAADPMQKPIEKALEKPAEKPPEKALAKFTEPTILRALPGALNEVNVFNSNSPEMVLEDGILLSTFPFEQMAHPECHLNFAFKGDFDLFAHHVTKAESDSDERVLWLGFLVGNPSNKKVHLKVLRGATYVSQPDAPFVTLPELSSNDDGKVFAGPGDRVANEVLRGASPTFLPKSIEIPAGQNKLLVALPLPVRKLRPALNGRSLLLKLNSSGPVHLASLAKYVGPSQAESGPTESQWLEALNSFKLATPRDKTPTEPFVGKGGIIFGRVAGVGIGNQWNATIADALNTASKNAATSQSEYLSMPGTTGVQVKLSFSALPGNANGRVAGFSEISSGKQIDLDPLKRRPGDSDSNKKEKVAKYFSIPQTGQSISFPLCTVERGTFGTGQIQSAPLLVSYADTAYLANGNYGITYKIDLPLYNQLKETVNVQLLFRTPIKTNEAKQELQYYEDPPPRAHFRGTVKVVCEGKTKFWHLVQRQGCDGSKIAELVMPAGSRKKVTLEFIYPPDATPPHVISIETIKKMEDAN
jgi:hypothetical protein